MGPIDTMITAAMVAAGCLISTSALAHGYAGSRFFPATVLIEDPFVADELALPTITHTKGGEEAGVSETEYAFEFAKRITSSFGLSIDGGWSRASGDEGDVAGFGNLGVGAKYQMLTNEEDEFVLSAGVDAELGGTGSERLDVEGFNTYTPAIYFGKGLGTLPKSADLLRPFAVTGFAGIAIPGRRKTFVETIDPDTLDRMVEEERHVSHIVYGAAIEYSLPYLHANVRDIGLPDWLNQVTPLVEVSLSTPVESNDGERTTGTINPGLIWSGRSIQLAAEAVIPINRDSGDTVGFTVQLHLYLDDIFPTSIGKPLLGDDAMRPIAWSGLLVVVALALSANAAFAHAALRHAVPAAGAVMSKAPDELQLEFSESVDMSRVELRLTPEGGAPVALTEPETQPATGTIVRRQISVRLKPGIYNVFWRAISVDAHWTRGDYSFEIRASE